MKKMKSKIDRIGSNLRKFHRGSKQEK